MHILVAIIGVLGAIGYVLYRLSIAAEATKEVVESAKDAGSMVRRWGWRRKFAKDPLDFATDPREATVALMAALAQSDGAMTERERGIILDRTVHMTGGTAVHAEELLAHGRWMVRDSRDLNRCFAKLTPLLRQGCTREQMDDVLAMLDDVAHADGAPGPIQLEAISRLRRALT
jgi:uncharacterized tellurite resistance protein B-like protein